MTFLKEFTIFALFFLLLSLALQSLQAYILLIDMEFVDEVAQTQPSRVFTLFIIILICLVGYIALIVTPFVNLSHKNMLLGACSLIVGRYFCYFLQLANILVTLIDLIGAFMGIVGQTVFYLTSVRVIQLMCERHGLGQKTGTFFGFFAGLYALSVLAGYGLTYSCYMHIPGWAYLMLLVVFVVGAGAICYFAFQWEVRAAPVNQLHEQQHQQENINPAGEALERNQQLIMGQIFNEGIPLAFVLKKTIFIYKKMTPIILVEIVLGIFAYYSIVLLLFLIWTSQTQNYWDKQIHHMDVVLIFCGGAIVASVVVGLLCDYLPVKKIGYGVLILTLLTFLFLYLAIGLQYFYTTLVMYLFVGMSIFSLWTWLLCVCSKIYGGKFQIFAVNMQLIAIGMSLNDLGGLLFGGLMRPGLILGLGLGLLIIVCGISFWFVKKLPQGLVDIVFEEQIEGQVGQRQEQRQGQVEMGEQDTIDRKIEETISSKESQKVDPQNLL